MSKWLTIIGMGEDGWDGLSAKARLAIETAEVIIARRKTQPRLGILRRHLNGLLVALRSETIVLVAEIDLAHAEVVVGREECRILHLGRRLLGVRSCQQHVLLGRACRRASAQDEEHDASCSRPVQFPQPHECHCCVPNALKSLIATGRSVTPSTTGKIKKPSGSTSFAGSDAAFSSARASRF